MSGQAKVLVLTGGIGAGKSTAVAAFIRRGVPTLDADDLSHRLTQRGGEALEEIRATWGPGVISSDAGLDRAAMRDLVFRDPAARRTLESILHPKIQALAASAFAACNAPYMVYVVPLWFEVHGHHRPPWVWRIASITAPLAERRRRVAARSPMPDDVLDNILSHQVNDETRRLGSDDLLANDGPPDMLDHAIGRLHAQLQRHATDHSHPDQT
ncbi:MAG: dephospho-CoA kinase [Burkholderiaceae bacterium]|jgi:dephospho-CoA kinase|nr:dephospho-CoA kinase [Burkholderiaceae bacterium]MDP4800875.1 dephospho-CoA kinase [Burkholderiaceae bacterium]